MDKISSTIRVEFTKTNENTAFYGNMETKSVYEVTTTADVDKRENVLNRDFYGALKISDGTDVTIRCDGSSFDSFDYADSGCYVAYFEMGGEVFELDAWVGEDGEVEDVKLMEWYDRGDYEDGSDEDVLYTKDDFEIYLWDE